MCSIYRLCSWEKEVGKLQDACYCTPCEEVSGPLWLWWSTAQVCARPSRKSKNMLQRFDLRHLPGHLVAEGRHKECWCVNSVRSAYSSHTQLISCPCFVLCEPDRLSFEFISFSSASNYMQQCLSFKVDSSSAGQAIFFLSWNNKSHHHVYVSLPVDAISYQLNPVQRRTPSLREINFTVVLPSTMLPKRFLSFSDISFTYFS